METPVDKNTVRDANAGHVKAIQKEKEWRAAGQKAVHMESAAKDVKKKEHQQST